jgi:hypothetical protein
VHKRVHDRTDSSSRLGPRRPFPSFGTRGSPIQILPTGFLDSNRQKSRQTFRHFKTAHGSTQLAQSDLKSDHGPSERLPGTRISISYIVGEAPGKHNKRSSRTFVVLCSDGKAASFGTRGSQVQILPFRPNKIKDLGHILAEQKSLPPLDPPLFRCRSVIELAAQFLI